MLAEVAEDEGLHGMSKQSGDVSYRFAAHRWGNEMRIFPDFDSSDEEAAGFEVDSAHIGIFGIARLLERLPSVAEVARRPPFQAWGDVRVRFRFRGIDFVVVEPFGDNSRYWIGPVEPQHVDTRELKDAFQSHVPPWPRRFFAGLMGVNRLGNRREEPVKGRTK